MIAIGEGQAVEVLKSGERGVVLEFITQDNGRWAVGVLFGDDEVRYFSTSELVFIQDK